MSRPPASVATVTALDGHLARLSPQLAGIVRGLADPRGLGRLDPAARSLRPGEPDIAALVQLTADASIDWGPEGRDARTGRLLTLLWEEPPDAVLEIVPRHYAAHGSTARMALLAAVAAVGSARAAETFAALIEAHGWPARPYPRVFRELGRLLDHGELFVTLYRKALEDPAAEVERSVGDLLLEALARGTLQPARLAALAPAFVPRLRAAIVAARPFQRSLGVRWRFDEDYAEPRAAAGFLADLAGWLAHPDLRPALAEALALPDPWIACLAACSLLRLGASVDGAAIERVAACHETRAILFVKLEQMKLLSLFPFAHASLESFAAADMVRWLMFPTELGREPDALEEMARLEVGGGQVVFAWRFLDGERWLAAVSGPYDESAPAGPITGGGTFSRFEPWEKQSAAEHVRAIFAGLASQRG